MQPPYCLEDLFTYPLASNGRPIVARLRFRGNMFAESLPSNGSVYQKTFCINLCADVRDTGLSSRRLWFIVGFMVYKVAFGHVYLQMGRRRSS
jgi:hypothetical protein